MKNYLKKFIYLLIILAVLGAWGCTAGKGPEIQTLDQAHEKFLKICNGEDHLNVTLTPLKNTLWIYVPMETPLFEYKADDAPPVDPAKFEKKFSVNYLDVKYQDEAFVITYDIAMEKFYPKDYGFSSKNSEAFANKYRMLYSAISRTYLEIASRAEEVTFSNFNEEGTDTDEDKIAAEDVTIPDFFVIVFADVKTGIESEIIFKLDDYKKQAVGLYPQEEYQKRSLSEMRGNTAIIGDYTGNHLNYREITMPEFLARQMENRINFKFTKSDFPPEGNPEDEVLRQAAITVKTYDFHDFDQVVTVDKRMDITHTYSKNEVLDLAAEPAAPQGKIHVIKFQ